MRTATRPSLPRPLGVRRTAWRKKRFSPLALIGVAITLLIVVGAGIVFVVQPYLRSHAANANPDCALVVPPNPLSARGLATPYQLRAQNADNGPCNEANADQSAFVQAGIIDPATGQISIYNPLVIDQNTQPAIAPVTPQLPANAVVAIWFGFNGGTLALRDRQGSLMQGKCVNGADGTIFGQFAYCNAPAFFQAANTAIQAGKLKPPALATAKDGMTCPTVRDFSVVDQDQSDNLPTSYLITANGRTTQMTAANGAALPNAQVLTNASDNRLLDIGIDGALGCSPWTAPDLADPGQMVAALPLNELQAAAHQPAPVAIVPAGDPMVLNNGKIDLNKTNAYRMGVDQQPAANQNAASTNAYCQNLLNVGLPRIVADAPLTAQSASPDAATGNNLFTFLAARFVATFGADNLNCTQLLGVTDPLAVIQNNDGVAIRATLNGQPINTLQMGGTTTGGTNMGGTNMGGTTMGGTAPNCNLNGTTVKGCMGTTTIDGQTCTVAFMNNTVTLTCPNPQTPPPGGTTTGGTTTGMVNPNPLPLNNKGISNDNSSANFDNVHYSYSAQALQNAGITPGKMIPFNGINFFWPTATPGMADNVRAQGQVIPITPVKGATTLGFLGAADFGPSMGTAIITYTDGSRQFFTLAFTDWTLNGGFGKILPQNQVVAVMPYRNTPTGGMQMQTPNVFYTSVPLQAGKTIKSVTLPARVNRGGIHVFAIGTK